MIAPQTYTSYPAFGISATKCMPTQVKYDTGYIPGDVLPAEHLNWFLACATCNITLASVGITNLQQEMQTVLCCAGMAPSACTTCVDQVYNAMMYQINACTNTKAAVGNTAGCPLGTADAGTATTAARSDHVHELPSCVKDKFGTNCIGIGFAGESLSCAQVNYFAAYSKNYTDGCTIIKDVPIAVAKCILGICDLHPNYAACSSYLIEAEDCGLEHMHITVCCSDEVNMHLGLGKTIGWVNYRGGASEIKIGNGGAQGVLGNIYACKFCGEATKAFCVYFCGSAIGFKCLSTPAVDCICFAAYNKTSETIMFSPRVTELSQATSFSRCFTGMIINAGCNFYTGCVSLNTWNNELKTKSMSGIVVY